MRPGWLWRRLTWRSRALPKLIIVGAQKCGTSSLFSYIRQHPDLHPSVPKEVHYFDGGRNPSVDTFSKGERWYKAHLPLQSSLGGSGQAFEASPLYLFHPMAARRIAETIPDVRLIVLVRDPVQRAVSHFHHQKSRGREPLGLLDALEAEEARLGEGAGGFSLETDAYIHCSYKRRGLYREQLERYFEHFRREQVLILESDRFFRDPVATLRAVFDFAGVDSDFAAHDLSPRMVGDRRGDIPAPALRHLEEYFAEPNQALYELVGDDYGW